MNKRKGIIILLGLATAVAVHATINEKNFETVNLLDSSRVFDIDEVVVISQPKESFVLRKQPLSSSIFGKQDFTALNVRDIRELSAYVPSFVWCPFNVCHVCSRHRFTCQFARGGHLCGWNAGDVESCFQLSYLRIGEGRCAQRSARNALRTKHRGRFGAHLHA